MEEWSVGDVWHGQLGTDYEGVEATIEQITARLVQVSFNRLVAIDGMNLGGNVFYKSKFRKLFDQQKHEQLNLFEMDS